ncbi:hypothetical protein SAMN05518672_1011341 [Chitinophaga sp. CF118]|uniref:hypothetical protein n=1 Tax=Chitinophaga sp. CF118 TaxID=1884367 RepID=UPI0008E8D61B|nr:hypothetical protein [Chitinophaga sp. CF118]SFD26358.1 hypothetical protein SAMN05518672_1011341 [Chitinophaga sp. CF118]
MLSRLIQRTTDNSPQDQFVKLYYDAMHTDLFGWLYTFANPQNPELTIEIWALVNPDDIDLSGICLYPVVLIGEGLIPGDFESWRRFFSSGPGFGAFIFSISYMISSSFNDPEFEGYAVSGIYNQEVDGQSQELVSVSAQTEPEILDAQTTTFDQIMQMSTLEATKPAFLYTEKLLLMPTLTPQEFIQDKGIPGMELTEVAVIMYEKMLTKVCDITELLPEDFFLFINSR